MNVNKKNGLRQQRSTTTESSFQPTDVDLTSTYSEVMELLIRLKFFLTEVVLNLVKIIAHQFFGQNNCLQILNSCHYSPCQLEGQQTAPSKNGQSQEQAFTSHNLCQSWWESGD